MPWPGSMAAIEQYTVPEAPPSPRSVMPRKTNMPRSAAASRMSWSSGPSASTAASTYSAYACFWAGSLNAAPFVRQTQNGYPARNVSGNTATPAAPPAALLEELYYLGRRGFLVEPDRPGLDDCDLHRHLCVSCPRWQGCALLSTSRNIPGAPSRSRAGGTGRSRSL